MSTKYILPSATAPVAEIIRKALDSFMFVQVISEDPALMLDATKLRSKMKVYTEPLVAQIVASLSGDAENQSKVLRESLSTELTRHAEVVARADRQEEIGTLIDAILGTLAATGAARPAAGRDELAEEADRQIRPDSIDSERMRDPKWLARALGLKV